MTPLVERNQLVATITTTGTTPAWGGSAGSYQASIVSPTGANSFTLTIEVSNDGTNWLTSYLTLTSNSASSTPASDGDASEVNYAYARINCSALALGSGTSLILRRAR